MFGRVISLLLLAVLVAACEDDLPKDATSTATMVVQPSLNDETPTARPSPTPTPPTPMSLATPVLVKPTMAPPAMGLQRYDGPCLTIDIPAEGWSWSTDGISGELDGVIVRKQPIEPASGMHDLGVGGIKVDIVIDRPTAPAVRSSPSAERAIVGEVTSIILGVALTEPIVTTVYENPAASFEVAERGFRASVYAMAIEDVITGAEILESANLCAVGG